MSSSFTFEIEEEIEKIIVLTKKYSEMEDKEYPLFEEFLIAEIGDKLEGWIKRANLSRESVSICFGKGAAPYQNCSNMIRSGFDHIRDHVGCLEEPYEYIQLSLVNLIKAHRLFRNTVENISEVEVREIVEKYRLDDN